MEVGLRKKIDYLYADCTEDYRIPMECMPGDTVEFRLRAPKTEKMKAVLLVGEERFPMEAFREKGCFSWYRVSLPVMERQWYLYEVTFEDETGTETVYYGAEGVKNRPEECFPFVVTPGFITPAWSRGAVYYQIYVDRFCQGNPMNDVLTDEYAYINGFHSERVTDWNSLPHMMDVHRFYGGDLQGVRKKLDYLQYLGVEVLYFNPLFVSPSNHKYDTQDYDAIDPHFTVLIRDEGELLSPGSADNREATRYICRSCDKANLEASNAWFASFVKEVHARGMKIVLDGVFNHCGSFNRYMDRERIYQASGEYEPGAFLSAKSPYRDYFYFQEPNAESPYEGWWNFDTLPKLNYDSENLQQEIIRIGKKWVSEPYCVDGWRLDVAADLGHDADTNHAFWKRFRKEVKAASQDTIILAEHYGDPSAWLMGDEWDTVMNYDGFMEPVTFFLTGMEKHGDRFEEGLYNNGTYFFDAMHHQLGRMQVSSVLTAMNELSNHDHSRFLTRTNQKVGRMGSLGSEAASQDVKTSVLREAVIIQMTWPGAPTLYYGDEAGLCGFTDPDNRRTYPWGREDLELIDFHKYVIGIHKKSPALRHGSYRPLLWDYGLIAYGRFTDEEQILVVVNNVGERTVTVPVWTLGVEDGEMMESLVLTKEGGYNVGTIRIPVEDGCVTLQLRERSAGIFRAVSC